MKNLTCAACKHHAAFHNPSACIRQGCACDGYVATFRDDLTDVMDVIA